MIIEIKEDLFYKLVELMKNRNTTIYNELKEIKPLDTVATDNTLQQAREIRTQKIKESIKETIQKLLSQDIQPTKYKINKKTGIANVTINKYYDDILKEVKNGNE
ncbi:hypothetical protein [Aliarcobacter cryaerophilus]|uniref:hypothetical protein n=1 Tax=Aliarcobacter cryaerophilus TaxID=28198 RepID=UPI0021B30786|nr:hypothetical protein [Aliarcobacter cryaerophilus]MCT7498434.1 hypothetical protein [Aliarcobacter cryaerophilus]MCT7543620.1 hypothetical protein [Aliarcobacter cryaerophilus]